MALTKAKVSFVEGLDGAVLTGAMPAVDGSSLTGISGMTKVTSNPTVSTNPSDGVGAIWVNKSTGEMLICKDATTDANVWVNIGGGLANVASRCYGGAGGGTIAGFCSAGSVGSTYITLINRFSFATGVASTWGNVSLGRNTNGTNGVSSSTHGFVLNGYAGAPNNRGMNVIDKFPFANDGGSTDFGDLNFQRSSASTSYNQTRAYVSAGRFQFSPPHVNHKNIQTFLFANNSSNTNHGDLSRINNHAGSCSSNTHGYVCGGANTDGGIDKFAFASSGGTRISGDLNGGVASAKFQFSSSGHSSNTRGYLAGGDGQRSSITSFSFASDSAAGTDNGNLVQGVYTQAGSTSTTKGFLAGRDVSNQNIIQSFSFDNNNIVNDIGDLTRSYSYGTGAED